MVALPLHAPRWVTRWRRNRIQHEGATVAWSPRREVKQQKPAGWDLAGWQATAHQKTHDDLDRVMAQFRLDLDIVSALAYKAFRLDPSDYLHLLTIGA